MKKLNCKIKKIVLNFKHVWNKLISLFIIYFSIIERYYNYDICLDTWFYKTKCKNYIKYKNVNRDLLSYKQFCIRWSNRLRQLHF